MTEQTETAAQPTMADRVAELGIRLSILAGPEWGIDEDGWRHNAFRVQLRRPGHSIASRWRQGEAHGTTPPTAADVLDSFLTDVSCFDSVRDFDDFAREFGYDFDDDEFGTKLKRARKTYRQLESFAPRMRAFLGDDADAVIYDTERL